MPSNPSQPSAGFFTPIEKIIRFRIDYDYTFPYSQLIGSKNAEAHQKAGSTISKLLKPLLI